MNSTRPTVAVAALLAAAGTSQRLLVRDVGRAPPYTAIASGALAAVPGDVEAITGRRPMSFREFLTVGGPSTPSV